MTVTIRAQVSITFYGNNNQTTPCQKGKDMQSIFSKRGRKTAAYHVHKQQIDMMRSKLQSLGGIRKVCRESGIARSHVTRALRGETWLESVLGLIERIDAYDAFHSHLSKPSKPSKPGACKLTAHRKAAKPKK
jgi:DNA-binding phage protein